VSVAALADSGSGLGTLELAVADRIIVKYSAIPHFATATVAGHGSYLCFGTLRGVSTICMVGRLHYYEGHSLEDIMLPIRVFG
jgi:purine-nucleoside phosphorylase